MDQESRVELKLTRNIFLENSYTVPAQLQVDNLERSKSGIGMSLHNENGNEASRAEVGQVLSKDRAATGSDQKCIPYSDKASLVQEMHFKIWRSTFF